MSINHRALDESDIALIECIKLTPSLYDPRNADFRFAHRKEQDWEKVAMTLGMPNAKDAKRRWTCLRDRYSRELKIIRLHPDRNGYGKNNFFRIMDFLRCFVRKRRERRRNTTQKSEDTCWDRASSDDNKTILTAKLLAEHETTVKQMQQDSSEMNNGTRYTASSITSNKSELAEEYKEYIQNPEPYDTNTIMETENVNVIVEDKSSFQNPRGAVPVIKSAGTVKPTPINICLPSTPEPVQIMEHKPTTTTTNTTTNTVETEDDYFCKSVAAYLGQLSRRHKIKAKVEMFQILEKFIEIEENEVSAYNK